jgi:hypothetical protein
MDHTSKTSILKIGAYTLSGPIEFIGGTEPPFTMQRHIMIHHESGEGMSVPESVLADLIAKFYADNF